MQRPLVSRVGKIRIMAYDLHKKVHLRCNIKQTLQLVDINKNLCGQLTSYPSHIECQGNLINGVQVKHVN